MRVLGKLEDFVGLAVEREGQGRLEVEEGNTLQDTMDNSEVKLLRRQKTGKVGEGRRVLCVGRGGVCRV